MDESYFDRILNESLNMLLNFLLNHRYNSCYCNFKYREASLNSLRFPTDFLLRACHNCLCKIYEKFPQNHTGSIDNGSL